MRRIRNAALVAMLGALAAASAPATTAVASTPTPNSTTGAVAAGGTSVVEPLTRGCGEIGSHPYLSWGSTGRAVRHAQCQLNTWGYSLAVDGIFGPRTHSAVVDVQRRCGIARDGIIGPNTWACIH